jgi:hypothetical protein
MVIKFGRRSGVYYEFSNFYASPVTYNGLTYKTSEGAFQAQKCPERASEFVDMTGSQAKKRGRAVPMRPDWDDVKFNIMCEIVLAKFSQNERLKRKLLSTGNAWLVENTTGWHDNIWGACSCSRCMKSEAKDWLGIALMKARAKLRDAESTDEVSFTLSRNDFNIPISTFSPETMSRYDFIVDKISRYAE